MAQPFSFSFNDEDIEDGAGEEHEAGNCTLDSGGKKPALLEPQLHRLDEMVSSKIECPCQSSYMASVLGLR